MTSAGQGFGLALVRGLCRRLVDGVVYLTSRDRGLGQRAANALRGEGLTPRFEPLDVRDTAGVRSLANTLAERHGGVDIVIANTAARIRPGVRNQDQVRRFVDIHNHGTHRMITAFTPLLNDGARFVVMASPYGSLRHLPHRLRARFDVDGMSLGDLEKVMDDYVDAVESGRSAAAGWPGGINIPARVGQVAAVKVMARELGEDGRRDILVNAASPGWDDTDGPPPFSPEQAASDVLWLATLPPGTREPYAELVEHRGVIPFQA